MNPTNHPEAWAIMIQRKAERKNNRPAYIAALIANRCKLETHLCEAYAVELVRLAGLIHAEAEAACNVPRTPAQEAAGERHEARFKAIAEALGFEARTGGDPRGACAYLIDPHDRKGDGWGDGWAVYR